VTFVHNGQGYTFADKRALALRLANGTDVLAYFDPAQPTAVHVCDLAGRYLVELRSLHVDLTNQAAMDDASRHISQLYQSILGGIRARPLHQLADQQQAADRAHNAAIVAETAPATERKPGLTAVLNRTVSAPAPGEAVHTPTAEATAQAMVSAAQARTASARTDRALTASEDLDTSSLL
jgi:hypothetical protein